MTTKDKKQIEVSNKTLMQVVMIKLYLEANGSVEISNEDTLAIIVREAFEELQEDMVELIGSAK